MAQPRYNQNSVQGQILNKVKNENREEINWQFYDSNIMTASVTNNLSFFQNSIGQTGSKNRTNMQTGGQLPAGKGMAVHEITMKLINPSGAPFFFAGGAAPTIDARAAIFASMFWDFKLDQTTMYEGHGSDIFEPLNYMNDTAAALGQATNGASVWGYKTVKFKYPIIIPPVRNFSLNVTLTAPAAGTGYTAATTLLYAFIKGDLYRAS